MNQCQCRVQIEPCLSRKGCSVPCPVAVNLIFLVEYAQMPDSSDGLVPVSEMPFQEKHNS